MAYQKSVYRSIVCTPGCSVEPKDGRRTTSTGRAQSRGGTSPRATDTRFGAPDNQHRSPHRYQRGKE